MGPRQPQVLEDSLRNPSTLPVLRGCGGRAPKRAAPTAGGAQCSWLGVQILPLIVVTTWPLRLKPLTNRCPVAPAKSSVAPTILWNAFTGPPCGVLLLEGSERPISRMVSVPRAVVYSKSPT